MAWTEITRPKYRRDGLRYASDTTNIKWAMIAPHLPPKEFPPFTTVPYYCYRLAR
jgi:hypothetical protein